MFQKISLTNYRTHKFTEIELHPVTLLIGNNNSGKSNFLALHYSLFSKCDIGKLEYGGKNG
jgi:predicted ATPase